MLQLSHCCIHHIPRTGGMYIRELLTFNKVPFAVLVLPMEPEQPYTFDHEIIDLRTAELHHMALPPGDKPALMIARNPLSWYPSLFAHRMSPKGNAITVWNPHRPMDLKCADGNFIRFMDKVMNAYPAGFLTQLYMTYRFFSTTIGRMETLFEDVSEFVKAHEGIELKLLDKKVNSNEWPPVSSEMRVAIKNFESKVFEDYFYALKEAEDG